MRFYRSLAPYLGLLLSFFAVSSRCKSNADSSPTSGTLTMSIDGSTVTYKAVDTSCSLSFGFSCAFSPTGSAADYPQIKFFFNRALASGMSFTTASPGVFLGDTITYYENTCQNKAGGSYHSYDTNGTMQVSVSEYSDMLTGIDTKFSFSGAVYRTSPAYSKTIASGSVNLHMCVDSNSCGAVNGTAAPAVLPADTINRNQLYSGITIGQKESKCYLFTPPSVQTYTVTISSAITVNSLSMNYGYSSGSGAFSFGSCGTAGNGSCAINASAPWSQIALEIMAGNNLAGSFSLQVTP